jgi:hypothetical protein
MSPLYRSTGLHCNAGYGGDVRPLNLTYLFLNFLVVRIDSFNIISHNVATYKNVTMTLKQGTLYFPLILLRHNPRATSKHSVQIISKHLIRTGFRYVPAEK